MQSFGFFFCKYRPSNRVTSFHYIILYYFIFSVLAEKIIAFCLGGNCDNNMCPRTHTWTHTHARTHI